MKIKLACDSGANIKSCRQETMDLADLGLSLEEWRAMSDDEKQQVAQDWANDRLEIWYEEILEDGDEAQPSAEAGQ